MKSLIHLLCILSAAGYTLSLPITARDLARQQDLFQRNQRNGGMYKREPAHILYEAIEERDLGGGAGIQPQQQQEGESRSGNLPGAITKREAEAEAGVEERAPENLFENVS